MILRALAAAVLGVVVTLITASLLEAQPQPPAAQLQPIVATDVRHDVSPPLTQLARPGPIAPERFTGPAVINQLNKKLPSRRLDPKLSAELEAQGLDPLVYFRETDPVIQSPSSPAVMPGTINNFEGISQNEMQAVVPPPNNYIPPDTIGDIGYDPSSGKKYYVQWVNVAFVMWDVTITPTRLLTAPGNSLWSGFGGPCETTNNGDPIVLFDQLANRWLLTQFSHPNDPNGPFYQCIAVSQSANPTGAYYRYAFLTSETKLNDYPHFGVWPDGYYMTVNQFNAGTLSWAGAGVFVFERAKILSGLAATMQSFDLHGVDPYFSGMLPADLDGSTPPPAGAPDYFAEADDNSVTALGPNDALRLWKFHVDWATPGNSTFGVNGEPNYTLTVAAFNSLPCVLSSSTACILQPGGAPPLDGVGDRLMHRMTYRNFGDHEALTLNHTVDAGSGRAGIRWYELRGLGSAPSIYQQGTYAPADTESRWMGSLAADHIGNIALGYSVSSATVYPSIRYAGRLTTDPLGQLAQSEASIMVGQGAQTDPAARWGDYSAMTIDPLDDCTFWYTQEYYPVTAGRDWHTRIASFKFPNCTNAALGTLRGTVTNNATAAPIANALVTASAAPAPIIPVYTDAGGGYTVALASGVYTVTASAYGFVSSSTPLVNVTASTTSTRNFALPPAATAVISGFVRDSVTHDPLTATLGVIGLPFNPPFSSVGTNPATGFYSMTLAANQSYTLTVSALLHTNQIRSITPTANRTENFDLVATTQNGAIAGWVRNGNTGQPIDQALVSVTASGNPTTTTDTNGYFQFLNLTPGLYTTTASAALYVTTTITNIQVLTSNVALRTFQLPASRLAYAPARLQKSLLFGATATDAAGLVISNTGQVALNYQLAETPGTVPWLSESPLSGTLAASGAQNVQLAWDASILSQPGLYTVALSINNNDPLAQNTRVPVTLTVQPLPTQGLLTGVVSTTGSCDVNLAPIANAQVVLEGSGGFTQTLLTDANGAYHYWLDQTHNPYMVTVTALDQSKAVVNLVITGGSTITRSFMLRLQQPCLTLSPLALQAALQTGQSLDSQLVVTNSGALPLNYSVYEVAGDQTGGGTDAFGYTWLTIPYNWIDATDGTALNLSDDGAANISLPFNVPFYGSTSNILRISNNGAALYNTLTSDPLYANQPLNGATVPNYFLAPFWDDLTNTAGNVYWKVLGNALDRQVVVEWYNRPHYVLSGGLGAVTFEMVMHENGNIVFQYQDVDFGSVVYNAGASATVGLRGASSAESLQVSYNAPNLRANQAICFTRPGNSPCDLVDYPWLSIVPTRTLGLIGTPASRQVMTVTFSAPALVPAGLHTGTLRIISNDPYHAVINLPVTLRIESRLYLPIIFRNSG